MPRAISPAISSSSTRDSSPFGVMAPRCLTGNVKRPRKVAAFRSPSASSASSSSASSSSAGPSKHRYQPYQQPAPTFLFNLLESTTPIESEHLLANINSRYPGAPGTALFRAREAAAKAEQAAKREADRKRREKEELVRLGVGHNMGKRSRESAHKRSESPFTSTSSSAQVAAPGASTRRSQRGADREKSPPIASGSSSRRSPPTAIKGSPATRNTALSSMDGDAGNNSLTVPTTSSNGRIRRPASRGSSPLPLTAGPSVNGHTSVNGSNGASIAASTRLGVAASSQPFQSSPLARDSTRFPSNPVGGDTGSDDTRYSPSIGSKGSFTDVKASA